MNIIKNPITLTLILLTIPGCAENSAYAKNIAYTKNTYSANIPHEPAPIEPAPLEATPSNPRVLLNGEPFGIEGLEIDGQMKRELRFPPI